MKKATVTTWRTASLLVLAAGLALVAFMVLNEGELGALPLALVLCGGLSSAAAWKRRPRD